MCDRRTAPVGAFEVPGAWRREKEKQTRKLSKQKANLPEVGAPPTVYHQ
jgi:hypothetical protein